MSERNINEVLHDIQQKLRCPKEELNSFGNFRFRKVEQILEKVKEFIPTGHNVIMSDELVMIGDRYYVKATATIVGKSYLDAVHAVAYARESLDKKGMDQAQVTGSSSSYARKYALCGLFAIDDSKTEPGDTIESAPEMDSDFSVMAELHDIKLSLLDCQTYEELVSKSSVYANSYKDKKMQDHVRAIFVEVRGSKFPETIKDKK